jgi:hypothetical protein
VSRGRAQPVARQPVARVYGIFVNGMRGVVQVVHEHVTSIGSVEPAATANVENAYITPLFRPELLLESCRDTFD